MAAPAGFVMKFAIGSNFPPPSGWLASARTYGCLGCSPVTDAYRSARLEAGKYGNSELRDDGWQPELRFAHSNPFLISG
jgi:hypothetical protein